MRHSRGALRRARERAIARAKRSARWTPRSDGGYGRAFRPWGYYVKRRYFDCGKPKCVVCHGSKYLQHREPTVQERKQFLREVD